MNTPAPEILLNCNKIEIPGLVPDALRTLIAILASNRRVLSVAADRQVIGSDSEF